MRCGYIQFKADLSLFYWYYEGRLARLFLVHADDFLWGGNSAFKLDVIDKLISTFQIEKEECGIFKFIGLEIKQEDVCITMDPQSHIDSVRPIPITEARSARKYCSLNKEEITSLGGIVGQPNWIALQNHPDIFYEVTELSSSLKDP